MVFSSFAFLLFFPLVTLLYYALPHRSRLLMLLGASMFFYAFFKPEYLLIIFFTIAIDYFVAFPIDRSTGGKRKFYLVLSLIANIGVLAFFKYYNFINENITGIASLLNFQNPIPALNIILPIGLSFHTFQAMSYTIEIYRGNCKPEKSFSTYSLYVMFYPQLVAGPIERPQNLLTQIHERKKYDEANVTAGLKMMLWGMFKKIVIADRLALYVDSVYSRVEFHSGPTLCIACVFFLLQIYCDFSAYSDIAIGTAKCMGFTLMQNFERPLFSRSVTEFWRRWHISLSSWLRDYLYTPLTISLRNWGNFGIGFSLLITFLIVGIWHGAGWNFVIFGLLHGTALIFEALTRKKRKKVFGNLPSVLNNSLSVFFTLAYAAMTMVFFRAKTVNDAMYVITHLWDWKYTSVYIGDAYNMIYSLLGIFILIWIETSQEFFKKVSPFWEPRPLLLRYFSYALVIVVILLIGVFDGGQFIYFQF